MNDLVCRHTPSLTVGSVMEVSDQQLREVTMSWYYDWMFHLFRQVGVLESSSNSQDAFLGNVGIQAVYLTTSLCATVSLFRLARLSSA